MLGGWIAPLLAFLALRVGTRGAQPIPAARASMSIRGASTPTVDAADDAALRHEYERYKAAVEMPLRNVDEATAQQTQPVRLRGLLSKTDIEELHRVAAATAAEQPHSTIDRSAWGQPEGTWRVTFLQTGGSFEAALPELHARLRNAMVAVDRDQEWNVTAGVADVNYRCVEHHTVRSELKGEPTGGGLHTKRHCDQGSLITIDILLTDLAEIEGGVLQTLESDDTLKSHAWEQGDALVFLSHKYHSVSRLTGGTRQVLVCELWQGTENHQPSRDEKERWQGEWKEDWRE
jgi:hypothetical protein